MKEVLEQKRELKRNSSIYSTETRVNHLNVGAEKQEYKIWKE